MTEMRDGYPGRPVVATLPCSAVGRSGTLASDARAEAVALPGHLHQQQ